VAHESFALGCPYVYAIIDLEEGLRMISNVINIAPSRVCVGMKVKVVFEDATPEIAIPRFQPMNQKPDARLPQRKKL